MHTVEIRKYCQNCGHHKLVKVPRFRDMKEDYCEVSGIPCARVKKCHPEMRVPKRPKRWTGEKPYIRSARNRGVKA